MAVPKPKYTRTTQQFAQVFEELNWVRVPSRHVHDLVNCTCSVQNDGVNHDEHAYVIDDPYS